MQATANSLDLFCGEALWDPNILSSTAIPVLSRCMQHTILVWIPALFTLLIAPLIAIQCSSEKNQPLPWTHLLSAKLSLTCLLILDSAFLFLLAFYESVSGSVVKPVDFVYPSLQFLSMVLISTFILACQRRGKVTSGAMWINWTLYSICGLPELYYFWSLNDATSTEIIRFVGFAIWYSCVVTQLFLFSYADSPAVDLWKRVENEKRSEEKTSSFINRQTMWWFNKICAIGIKKPLEVSDLYTLNSEDTSKVLVPRWKKLWNFAMKDYNARKRQSDQDVEPPSIIWRLFMMFRGDVILAMVIKCVSDLLQFANPLLLSALIRFTENSNLPLWYGVGLAILMFVASELSSIMINNYYYLMYRVGTRIQAVLTAAVYKKTLCLSNTSRREKTVGEIVNLMAIDVDRFQQVTPSIQQYWSTPMQISLALFLLFRQVGYSVISGVIVMLLLLPINFVITMQTRKYQLKQMAIKDERVKCVNEILNGMKVIKLYAYEKPMEAVITELRNRELVLIKKAAFLRTFSDMLNTASPFFVAASTFTTFLFSDASNILTPEIAFVSLTLFNQLRAPMSTVAELISQTVQVYVSNNRLKKFLVSEELEESARHAMTAYSQNVIDVKDADFTWDRAEPKPSLSGINLVVPRGQLIAVIGKVGSGKSSLLNCLLGEMKRLKGQSGILGTIAYVPQQPFIQNETIRNNIIFGRHFNESQYNHVLDTCALLPDLSILSSGDLTEIGERGINLSGGQKSRVNLARAVYQNRDVYLLDDPLSAVDVHVGEQLFSNVIGPDGILCNKTRILVTHELSYLKYANSILVMGDGKIQYSGTYDELSKSGALEQLIKECCQDKPAQSEIDDELFTDDDSEETIYNDDQPVDAMIRSSILSSVSRHQSTSHFSHRRRRQTTHKSHKSHKSAIEQNRQLTGVEKVETGRVKPLIYLNYFKAMGFKLSSLFLFGMIASTASSMTKDLWLTDWSNDAAKNLGEGTVMPIGVRLGVYAAVGFAEVALVFFGMSSLLFGGVSASRNLHSPLLHTILRAPMKFFDTTPCGRILNRIGKDIETIDYLLPSNVEAFVDCVLQIISTLVIIMISTPVFGIVVVPLTVLYLIILRYYIATSRQLKRLESISRSPIYSHLSESINGASSIRAYGSMERFCRGSERKVDTYVQCRYLNYVANRWLSIRLEFIGNCVVLFAALFAALTRGSTSAGVLGLSVCYSLNITFVLNFAVRQISKLETNIVSVERVKEYSEVETEAPWIISENRSPIGWPSKGLVEFSKYATRYRPGLDLVVRGITATINPGQKVGIVGRTGAGKSSLTLALFRMIEPAEGKIMIDGIDIRGIGLHDLRSNITIIPQEPVLFSGTLRFNLDPFGNFSDADLWQALEMAHLKVFASTLTNGLDYEITEGGDNISVGQRQLVCLARALLRKSKLLVLDEATAAVDVSTDALIQGTIRREFADSSVLTIAHRLNTIMDYDMVMVLEKGRIAEFAPPQELLADKSSLFAIMAQDATLNG